MITSRLPAYNSLAVHTHKFTAGFIAYKLDTGGKGGRGFKHYPIPGVSLSDLADFESPDWCSVQLVNDFG